MYSPVRDHIPLEQGLRLIDKLINIPPQTVRKLAIFRVLVRQSTHFLHMKNRGYLQDFWISSIVKRNGRPIRAFHPEAVYFVNPGLGLFLRFQTG